MRRKGEFKNTSEPKRDHRGKRGVPAPATFALSDLPGDCLLTTAEVASVLRLSTNTLDAWRWRQANHPFLKWLVIAGGRVRYRAGDVKAFIAVGATKSRHRRTKPEPESAEPESAKRRAALRDELAGQTAKPVTRSKRHAAEDHAVSERSETAFAAATTITPDEPPKKPKRRTAAGAEPVEAAEMSRRREGSAPPDFRAAGAAK